MIPIYIHDLRLTRCLARFQTGAAWIRPVKVTIEDNEYAALVAKAKPLLRSKPPVNVHDLPEKTNVAQTISKPTVLPLLSMFRTLSKRNSRLSAPDV